MGFVIHVALEKAVPWGVLDANPMSRVDLSKKLKKPVTVLDKARLSLFFTGAKGTRLYPFLILAAATGCRRGQLLALLWDDLNLSTRILTASKSLEETHAGLRIKSTKSGKERRLKVPEFAIEALLEHKKQQDRDKDLYGETYQDHGLVFCRPEGEYYTPDKVTARVTELARKLGFPKGITLHVLRHSHASQLLSKKTPIPVVSKRLGHANPNITMLIYAHALEEDEAQAAETWNEVFSEPESKV